MNQAQTRQVAIGGGFQRCGCIASSEGMTQDFITKIKAGYIPPDQMADVLYAMHGVLVDRFPAIGLWLPNDLEQVADSVVTATRIQDRQEQDYPEVAAA